MRFRPASFVVAAIVLVGCSGPKPFTAKLDDASLAAVGEAGTVKIFAFGDIDATTPSSINFTYATVQSVTGPVESSVLTNKYNADLSQGLVSNDQTKIGYEWARLLEDPGKYLQIKQTQDSVETDTAAFEGSGAVVSPDGLILTNAHVVSDGSANDPLPDIAMLNSLYGWLNQNVGPLPNSYQPLQVKIVILKWLLQNTSETFSFKEARVYLDDHSDNLAERLNELTQADGLPSGSMDDFIKSVTVSAEVLQKGSPWPGDDVAILKVPASNLIALPLADSSSVETGQRVVCFGFPGAAILEGLEPDDQYLVVSKSGTIGQSMSMQSGFNAYNISADINHGNSGGPVLNTYGQIIGLATAGNPNDNGENYAVPVSLVQQYVDKANAKVEVGDETLNWYDGLLALAKQKNKRALNKFEQVAVRQGAVTGESVLPGTVNRYVVEKIHALQGN